MATEGSNNNIESSGAEVERSFGAYPYECRDRFETEAPEAGVGECPVAAAPDAEARDANMSALAIENERLAKENAALQEAIRKVQEEESADYTFQGFPISVSSGSTLACASEDWYTYSPMRSDENYNSMWLPVDLSYCIFEVAPTGSQGQATCRRADSERTTVMLRNLPNNYTRAMLLDLLESKGFASVCNFLYLPIDFKTQAALGYAFVDLADQAVVQRFWKTFDGFSKWTLPSKKVCFVSWCEPHQGWMEHVERYRNSPVMHSSVPDEYKPVLFMNGQRVPFPRPSKAIRAPRVRHCQ
jgi:hypothetical protein